MQGLQSNNSHANLKSESAWFKTKLVSQFITLSFLLTQPFYLTYLHATPTGGEIVGGTGSITQTDIATTIYQSSQNLAVDWQSFDVNTNEKVNFIQPSTSSIALNRILGNNGSTIQGQINANGQVILVNPNGVFFTSTSVVNVGGIVASSLDLTPDDFMNGNYIFNEVLGTDGAVVNSGVINASLGGNVALIGKQVKNDGLISANLGSVVLAAGKQSVLTFDNQGLLGVKVTKEILQEELGLEEAVINNGEINAEGGRVLLSASTSQDVFSQAVNTNSLDQAKSVVVNEDGTFTLGAGADVLNTGSIDVSSNSNTDNTARIILLGENITSSGSINADVENGKAGEIEIHANDKILLNQNSITSAKAMSSGQGGLIKVLGDKVGLFDQSEINVAGFNGGGQILFGGDYLGQNTFIKNSTSAYVGLNTLINADATSIGNAGRVIIWGNDLARLFGAINVCGGINGGNGGFIETSAKVVDLNPQIDISAVNGQGGTWLIDPDNIEIKNGSNSGIDISVADTFSSQNNTSTLSITALLAALDNKSVTVIVKTSDSAQTEGSNDGGNITVVDNINFNSLDLDTFSETEIPTLKLQAHHDIIIDGQMYDSNGNNDAINLEFYADANTNNVDGGKIEFNALVETSGGHLIADTKGGDINFNDIVYTGNDDDGRGGAITATTVNGAVNITNEIDTNGGDFEANGANVTVDYQSDNVAIRTGGGSLKLIASTAGKVQIIDSYLRTNSGLFEVQGGNFTSTATNSTRRIRTEGGNVNLFVDGAINLGQRITTGGGNITTGLIDTVAPINHVLPTSFTTSSFGELSTSGGNVDIFAVNNAGSSDPNNGQVSIGSNVFTSGGYFNVGDRATSNLPDSFVTNASINTVGANNTNGGNIDIRTAGVITVNPSGELKTNGGTTTTGNTGTKGGDITLVAGDTITISSTNTISSLGSDGRRDGNNQQAGGEGGKVDISTTSGNINISSGIDTQGGSADGNSGNLETGGVGGNVKIHSTNGTVTVASINTTGGKGDTNNGDGNGGNAGSITLESDTSVTLTDNLISVGGVKGNNGTQGNGNFVTINANTVLNNSLSVDTSGSTNGDITFNGTVSATNPGVDNLNLTGKDITFTDDVGSSGSKLGDLQITATGSVKAESSPTVQKDLYVNTLNVTQSLNFTSGNIDVSALDDNSVSVISGTSNSVNIDSDNIVNIGNVFSNGGAVTTAESDGYNGADVSISASDITVGEINTSGTNAVGTNDHAGGSSGSVSITASDIATNGTPSVTLNGNINTQGGTGSGPTPGASGTTGITSVGLVVDGANTGTGSVDINYTGDFSTLVDITGSGGTDTLTASDKVNSWLITGTNAGNLNTNAEVSPTLGVTFTNIEEINGGTTNNDTLKASATTNTWSIGASGTGSVTGISQFRNMNNFLGNTGNDDFTVTGSIAGFINGGSSTTDTNTLTIQTPSTDVTWNITGENTGTDVNQTFIGNGFSNIHQIVAGDGNDTFTYTTSTSSIRDFIDGGGERVSTAGDSLNMSALTNIDIVLGDSTVITPSLGDLNVNNIETITGNNDGTSSTNTNSAKITGESTQDNSWSLTGSNTGIVNSSSTNVTFIDFTDITGGDLNDTFTIGATGELKKGNTTTLIDGQIDGGSHRLPLNEANPGDILDVASRSNIQLNINSTTGNTLTFSGPSLSFTNIETVEGGGSNSTVVGEGLDTSWDIFASDRGSVTSNSVTTYFRGFGNLTGGTANDAFTFRLDGSISGLINGGNHTAATTGDTVTVLNPNAAVNLALGTTANANANNITNIENVYGNNLSNVTLIGENLGTTNTRWNITNNNDGNLNSSWGVVNFTNVANLSGNDNVDEFFYTGLSDSGSGPGTGTWISGLVDGAGGSDLINMSGITDNFTINLESNFVNVEKIIGNAPDASRDTTLAGPISAALTPGTDVDWTITGTNDGNVVFTDDSGVAKTVIFENFRNLQGQNNVDDTFAITTGNMLGAIDGGAGSGTDSADYSLSSLTEISVGSNFNGIDGVEQVIGNSNIQLTGLQGQDQSNSWRIYDDGSTNNNGRNDGVVTYDRDTTTASNPIETLSFIDFGKLKAGVNGETFTIDQGGAFSGTIIGGAGADTVDLTLTGVEQGTLTYEAGGNNNDAIVIDGDNSGLVGDGNGYSGVYAINADGTEGFSYTNQSNLYKIEYSGVESVTDNLTASALTINGGYANDTITLNADNFHLLANVGLLTQHNATPVFYSNKNSLFVDALGGTADSIRLEGAQDFTNGTLSLKAENLTSSLAAYPLITANELSLDSITNTGTSTGKKLNTSINHLSVVNTGNLYVEEQNGINIADLDTTGLLDIDALNGNITGVDRNTPSINSDLRSSGILNLQTQNGNITLNGNNQLSGEFNLTTSTTNSIELRNTTTTLLNSVTTGNLTVVTTGTNSHINQFNSNSVISSSGLTRLSSSGNVDFSNAANDFTTLGIDSAQTATVSDSNDIALTSLSANTVDITAVSSISDSNGNSDNITATNLKLRAGTGIGNGNALETRVSSIDAITTSGEINIDNVGDITVTNLINNGNITLVNQGNVILDTGNGSTSVNRIDAGYGTRIGNTPDEVGGTFTLTVTGGSVSGSDTNRVTSFSNPDITAYNANIVVAGGTFGSRGRPISVHINNEFNLFSLQSAVKYIVDPFIENDTSTAKISITDAFSSLAGQQLIEVESIGDIDPAIFTDVRNYSHSDLALMMPSDQRYDVSDEEEEDKDAKEKRNKLINSEN